MKKRVINLVDNQLNSGQESGDLSLPPGQENYEGGILLSGIPHRDILMLRSRRSFYLFGSREPEGTERKVPGLQGLCACVAFHPHSQ
jgi:hypothetical protein